MVTNAKLQWTWVAISRLPKKVSRSTCKEFNMQVFMDGFVGARVFFSEDLAKAFKSMLMAKMEMRSNYNIRVVPDHELMCECEKYLADKFNK